MKINEIFVPKKRNLQYDEVREGLLIWIETWYEYKFENQVLVSEEGENSFFGFLNNRKDDRTFWMGFDMHL